MRQLCSDVRYIRIKNMNSDYSTYIYYKKENNEVISYVLRENGKNKKEVELPKETKLYNSINSIIFSPGGALSERGETIIIVDNKNNKKREITIVPFSGRILIKEGIYNN